MYKLSLLNNMAKQIIRKTYQIDAAGKSLGRIATEAAIHLIGKDKPGFEPNIDIGDFVHVKNIDKVKFTGNKVEQKKYYRHSTYPGGLKEIELKSLVEQRKYPDIFIKTVDKMLPKNKFRTARIKRITFGNK